MVQFLRRQSVELALLLVTRDEQTAWQQGKNRARPRARVGRKERALADAAALLVLKSQGHLGGGGDTRVRQRPMPTLTTCVTVDDAKLGRRPLEYGFLLAGHWTLCEVH